LVEQSATATDQHFSLVMSVILRSSEEARCVRRMVILSKASTFFGANVQIF